MEAKKVVPVVKEEVKEPIKEVVPEIPELTKEQQEVIDKETEQAKKLMNQDLTKVAIENNEYEFEVEGKKYKVVRPTTAQKQEAYTKKVTQYMKLLQMKDDNGNFIYYPDKKLREIYKERGIDVDEYDRKIEGLSNERNSYQEKLGKMLTDNPVETEVNILKEEIVKINDKVVEFTVARNSLLEYSLENQSIGFLYEYLTYAMTLVQNDKGEFVKCWNKFEDFKNADSLLTNSVGVYAGMMLGSMM